MTAGDDPRPAVSAKAAWLSPGPIGASRQVARPVGSCLEALERVRPDSPTSARPRRYRTMNKSPSMLDPVIFVWAGVAGPDGLYHEPPNGPFR
jgi:hypothetical protein